MNVGRPFPHFFIFPAFRPGLKAIFTLSIALVRTAYARPIKAAHHFTHFVSGASAFAVALFRLTHPFSLPMFPAPLGICVDSLTLRVHVLNTIIRVDLWCVPNFRSIHRSLLSPFPGPANAMSFALPPRSSRRSRSPELGSVFGSLLLLFFWTEGQRPQPGTYYRFLTQPL